MKPSLQERFNQKLDALLSSYRFLSTSARSPTLGLAFSGGVDSTALLLLLKHYIQDRHIPISIFHINHGLSKNAHDWEKHCQRICQSFGLRCFSQQIYIEKEGEGLEAKARILRYEALGEMCAQHHITHLLTAHHQQDQAETVLLNMLRGSGVAGLGGMDEAYQAEQLLQRKEIFLMRPLLHFSKSELQDFCRQERCDFVNDESNQSYDYTRNAIRHWVLPALEKITSNASQHIARSAKHLKNTHKLLQSYIESEAHSCMSNIQGCQTLLCEKLFVLDEVKQSHIFRFWLMQHQVQMPSEAKLNEILHQLRFAKDDAKVEIYHEDIGIYRFQKKIYLEEKNNTDACESACFEKKIFWSDETEIDIPELNGTLIFTKADRGVDPIQLQKTPLLVKLRQGGERIKLAVNRPSKDIKHICQELGIPYWQRNQLPFLYLNEALIFVGGLGMDVRYLSSVSSVHILGEHKISISWIKNRGSDTTNSKSL